MDKSLYDQINAIEETHWWYVGRRRLIFEYVLQTLKKYPDPRILDLGCGTGYNIAQLKSYGYNDVVGLDFTFDALTYCFQRQLDDIVCGDATQSPFKDESFDVITALDIIEHIPDDEKSLRDVYRLLKPGGSHVIFTPAYQFLWSVHDEISHHMRRYTARELRQKVEASGLVIDRLTYANTFLFPMILAGRMVVKAIGIGDHVSENDLHPSWSNSLLTNIFSAEIPVLRHMDFPFGVSLLCVAHKPA